MADEIDIANEVAQRMLDVQLAYRKPTSNLAPTGRCHWCGAEFDEDSLKLFCNSECATHHHRRYGY